MLGVKLFCLVQHYLTMLGSTVLIPFLIVPPMGGDIPFCSIADRMWSTAHQQNCQALMVKSTCLAHALSAQQKIQGRHLRPSQVVNLSDYLQARPRILPL